MNWYYVCDGKQDGPHSEDSLRELAKSGAIDSSTLLWCEGMADWQPVSQAAPHLLASLPPPAIAPVTALEAQCAECGGFFPSSEMITLRGSQVCANCKPVRLQKLQEGVLTGSAGAELARLLKVAKAQRGVNVLILISIICYGVFFLLSAAAPAAGRSGANLLAVVSLVNLLGMLAMLVFQAIYVYRLASALEAGLPILWLLGVLFLSCIGLILLLILSSKATKQLRDAGFKVGLLGGNPSDVERRMAGG